jgi:1-acyl-sn-glycerol-3-phosphate acyltransferase
MNPDTNFGYRVNYGWRVVTTGLSFAFFGIGGVVIALLMTLFFYLTPFSSNTKQHVVRSTISATFRVFINFMRLCGILTFEVRGIENLSVPGRLVIANHPSLLDVVFLISIIRNADCIVKEELYRNPCMRGSILAAGYMANNDSELIQHCGDSLAAGGELIIFPEGTRSIPGCEPKFQRGAANIAISSRCDIAPIVISCHPAHLEKHHKWYRVPLSRPHYVFAVLPPVAIEPYLDESEPQGRRARLLTHALKIYLMEHKETIDKEISSSKACATDCDLEEI